MATRKPSGPPASVLGLYTETPCGMDDPMFIMRITIQMRTEDCIRERMSYTQTLATVRASMRDIYPEAPGALVDGTVTAAYFGRRP
ncbi:MAG: hypothetical protein ING90_02130 [Rhodocyclaceae bacterium]|nr:hypothetical protein [Rhodocyclaceae bacterium]